MPREAKSLRPHVNSSLPDAALSERAAFEQYQAFMVGYVRRINEATLNVTIGGVRIGSAKYSRLAQINLRTRIITFSRFAVENVPERGRRLLVLHELAHVKEASHNKKFWSILEHYEPDYKAVDRELSLAFNRNVRNEMQRVKRAQHHLTGGLPPAQESLSERLLNYKNADRKRDDRAAVESPVKEILQLQLPLLNPYFENLPYREQDRSHQIPGISPNQYQFQEQDDCTRGGDRHENIVNWFDEEADGTIHGGCSD